MRPFEGTFAGVVKRSFLKTLPFLIFIKLSVFWITGLYKGAWQYMNLGDFIRIARAITLSSVGTFIILSLSFDELIVSKTIYIIDFFLSFFLIAGFRGSYRILYYFRKSEIEKGRRVLIYGAGLGGNLALREFIYNRDLEVVSVGFIDDDEHKKGKIFNGYPVISNSDQLDQILDRYKVAEIIVSSSKIGRDRLETLKNLCLSRGITIKRFHASLSNI